MNELEKCRFAKNKGFKYDHETGGLYGVRGNLITKKINGYIICQIWDNSKNYNIRAHRLAWYLHFGELPKNHIDHIDGDKTNNKIENLRDVTNHQNQWNRTKAKGYTYNKREQKYQAKINLNYKLIFLGYFKEEEDARNAYLEAKKKYHIIN